MVDNIYIGRGTVIAFADVPEFETYKVEIAREDKIKQHLAKPRNWVPQRNETLPEIPSDTAFICSPTDVTETSQGSTARQGNLWIYSPEV